jgi:hypothetical protein
VKNVPVSRHSSLNREITHFTSSFLPTSNSFGTTILSLPFAKTIIASTPSGFLTSPLFAPIDYRCWLVDVPLSGSRTPEINPTNYANVGSGIVTFLSVVAAAPLGM